DRQLQMQRENDRDLCSLIVFMKENDLPGLYAVPGYHRGKKRKTLVSETLESSNQFFSQKRSAICESRTFAEFQLTFYRFKQWGITGILSHS
ncbi:hypothetical protein KAU04_07100, partial [bacterium]|nr:hypothetical protein [bacterium]